MLRILTLNMWGTRGKGELRWQEAAEAISQLRANFVSLQEADDLNMLSKITSSTDLKLALAESKGKELAMLTSFPFSKETTKVYDTLSSLEAYVRKFESLLIETDKGPIYIVNTHLSWRAQDEPIRKGQAQELVRFCAKLNAPIILTGDFNSEYMSECLTPIRDAGFKDLMDGHPDALNPSWDNRNPYIQTHSVKFPDRRIDLILGNPSLLKKFKVSKAEIVLNELTKSGIYISDHFGVLVELN